MRRSNRATITLFAVAVTVASCGTTSSGVIPSADIADTEPCRSHLVSAIDRTVSVRLLVGPDVEMDRARRVLADAAAYYEPYGLDIEVTRELTISHTPLGADLDAVERRLRFATGHAAEATLVETLLEPIRRHLQRHAIPPRRGIDVVVVAAITTERSLIRTLIGDVAGLGLAPDQTDTLPEGALPAMFTPTVFVGLDLMDDLPRWQQSVVSAHEIAHALGLRHDSRPWNLMAPGTAACVPHLSPAQADAIRSAVG